MAEEKDKAESPKPVLTNYQKTLEKLAKLEEKLAILQDFNKQTEQLRETRKKLLENLITINSQLKTKESKTKIGEKRVMFADEQGLKSLKKSKSTLRPTVLEPSIYRSKSLVGLLTNLQTWHEEVSMKKNEIQQLIEERRRSINDAEGQRLQQIISLLEIDKDKLNEKILHFVVQNLNEGKGEYQEIILHLEEENKDMEDRLNLLQNKINYLKETNIGLMRENKFLRLKNVKSVSTISLPEDKFRKSLFTGRSSTLLPEAFIFHAATYNEDNKSLSPSVQLLRDMDQDEKLSLGSQSADSFQLDTQLATWTTDMESRQRIVHRIGQDMREMEVTQMKLNMIKRYVRKHGTKNINRHTLIDPSGGMSQ